MANKVTYQGRPTQMAPKDPNATITYGVDWTDYLEGNQILNSTWESSGDLVIESTSNDLSTTAVLLSGGTNGKTYVLTNRITYSGLSGVQSDDRSMVIPVREL